MAVNKVFTPKSGTDIPEGPQLGLLLNIIHIGVQKTDYQNVVNYRDQILVTFELPDLTTDDGRPLTQSVRVNNLSGPKSTMTKIVKALNGGKKIENGIDFESLLGKPLQLTIGTTSGGNPKITEFSPALASVARSAPKLVNEPKLLLDVDNIGDKELNSLPEWIRKVINERASSDEDGEGDISF